MSFTYFVDENQTLAQVQSAVRSLIISEGAPGTVNFPVNMVYANQFLDLGLQDSGSASNMLITWNWNGSTITGGNPNAFPDLIATPYTSTRLEEQPNYFILQSSALSRSTSLQRIISRRDFSSLSANIGSFDTVDSDNGLQGWGKPAPLRGVEVDYLARYSQEIFWLLPQLAGKTVTRALVRMFNVRWMQHNNLTLRDTLLGTATNFWDNKNWWVRQLGLITGYNPGHTRIPASGLRMINCTSVTINNLKAYSLDGTAVSASRDCNRISILSPSFIKVGGNGVQFDADETGDPDATVISSRYNTVFNGYFERVGVHMLGSIPISGQFVRDCQIVKNTIKECPYTGISIGYSFNDATDTIIYADVVYYPGGYATLGNKILGNIVNDSNLLLGDGGSFYQLGNTPGQEVNDNYFRVAKPPNPHSRVASMYFDNASGFTKYARNELVATAGSFTQTLEPQPAPAVNDAGNPIYAANQTMPIYRQVFGQPAHYFPQAESVPGINIMGVGGAREPQQDVGPL